MGDWVLCVGRSLQDRGLLSEVRAGQQKGAIRRGPVEGGLACRQAGTLLVLCPGFEHLMCPLVSRYEATKNPQKSRTVREELGEATCQTLSRFNEGLMGAGICTASPLPCQHGLAPAMPAWPTSFPPNAVQNTGVPLTWRPTMAKSGKICTQTIGMGASK